MSTDKINNLNQNAANVKVICRFRPINENENNFGVNFCYEIIDNEIVIKDKEK